MSVIKAKRARPIRICHAPAERPVWSATKSRQFWDFDERKVFVGQLTDGVIVHIHVFEFDRKVGAAVSADDGTLMYSKDPAPGVIGMPNYDVTAGAFGLEAASEDLKRMSQRNHNRLPGSPLGHNLERLRSSLVCSRWDTRGDNVCADPPAISSVAFIGDLLDRLLITTSSCDRDSANLKTYPDAERLFLSNLGATYQPTTPWNSSALKIKETHVPHATWSRGLRETRCPH